MPILPYREIRAIKQKKGTLKKQHIVGERVSYFKENLKADGNLYTPQEALELIERYVDPLVRLSILITLFHWLSF